jgi:predicted alpha-1,6-mannanase (GH76 family)
MQDNTLYNNTKTSIVFANSWLEWCRYHQIDVDDLISQGLAFDGTKLEEDIYQYMDEPLLDIEIKLYDVYLKEKEENRKGNYEYSK